MNAMGYIQFWEVHIVHAIQSAVCMQLWRYQGLKTLGDYLRRKDCIQALAADLQVPEHLAVVTVLKQLLECLAVRLVPK
jgi:hypothetical protein